MPFYVAFRALDRTLPAPAYRDPNRFHNAPLTGSRHGEGTILRTPFNAALSSGAPRSADPPTAPAYVNPLNPYGNAGGATNASKGEGQNIARALFQRINPVAPKFGPAQDGSLPHPNMIFSTGRQSLQAVSSPALSGMVSAAPTLTPQNGYADPTAKMQGRV